MILALGLTTSLGGGLPGRNDRLEAILVEAGDQLAQLLTHVLGAEATPLREPVRELADALERRPVRLVVVLEASGGRVCFLHLALGAILTVKL